MEIILLMEGGIPRSGVGSFPPRPVYFLGRRKVFRFPNKQWESYWRDLESIAKFAERIIELHEGRQHQAYRKDRQRVSQASGNASYGPPKYKNPRDQEDEAQEAV